MLQVEAILASRDLCGQKIYHLKWKDATRGTTWKTSRKTQNLCPDILRKFKADEKKANEV